MMKYHIFSERMHIPGVIAALVGFYHERIDSQGKLLYQRGDFEMPSGAKGLHIAGHRWTEGSSVLLHIKWHFPEKYMSIIVSFPLVLSSNLDLSCLITH